MKTPFTFKDGPLAEIKAIGLMVDSSLIGVTPEPGDKRSVMKWDRTRMGRGFSQGLYRFDRGEDGKVVATHIPGPDDREMTSQEVAEARKAAESAEAIATVQRLAEQHPEVKALLKDA